MGTDHWIAGVGGVGALAVVLRLLAPVAVPDLSDLLWPVGVGGVLYLASALAAWTLVKTDRDGFVVALSPAILTPPVALLAYAGWNLADMASLLTYVPTIAFLAVAVGIALSFPLGAATRRQHQWAVVAAIALAAVPLLAAAAAALTPGPPEDRNLLVLVGMVALSVAPIVAVPTYFLGRSTRERVATPDPSPYPPLVAAAMPYVLALAGFLPAPYFARETIYGPWIVIVPALVLLAIVAQGVRIRSASA